MINTRGVNTMILQDFDKEKIAILNPYELEKK